MNADLPKFGITLILGGIDPISEPDVLENIIFGFSMRPHIKNTKISWTNEDHKEITADLEEEGLDPKSVAKDAAEELLNVAIAVMRKVDGIHTNVIEIVVLNG